MSLTSLLAFIAPHECLGCAAEGTLLCRPCMASVPLVPERCYRCLSLHAGGKTCAACRASSPLYSVRSRAAYGGVAKELIWRLKFSSARAAATEIAAELAPLLPTADNLVLVPIPTATSRSRQRGYDQAQLIAKVLARRTGLPYVPALRRLGQHHQVGSNREQRTAQLKGAFRCVSSASLSGCHVILIDDVVTTGATLEAAGGTVLDAGAKRVSGLVFAQA